MYHVHFIIQSSTFEEEFVQEYYYREPKELILIGQEHLSFVIIAITKLPLNLNWKELGYFEFYLSIVHIQ